MKQNPLEKVSMSDPVSVFLCVKTEMAMSAPPVLQVSRGGGESEDTETWGDPHDGGVDESPQVHLSNAETDILTLLCRMKQSST